MRKAFNKGIRVAIKLVTNLPSVHDMNSRRYLLLQLKLDLYDLTPASKKNLTAAALAEKIPGVGSAADLPKPKAPLCKKRWSRWVLGGRMGTGVLSAGSCTGRDDE